VSDFYIFSFSFPPRQSLTSFIMASGKAFLPFAASTYQLSLQMISDTMLNIVGCHFSRPPTIYPWGFPSYFRACIEPINVDFFDFPGDGSGSVF
jgi:hypothetical protein